MINSTHFFCMMETEGEKKETKGGSGVVKVWDKFAGAPRASKGKSGEVLAQQLMQTSIGVGGGSAWVCHCQLCTSMYYYYQGGDVAKMPTVG